MKSRPAGERTIVALPSSLLFAERIALPPKASPDIIRGQIDVRLPVPVEDCLVLSGPPAHGPRPTAMVYAVPRDRFTAFLDSFRRRFGFLPERIAPAAEVLWEKLRPLLPAGDGCSIHLHAGEGAWTLLAGDGDLLAATLSIVPGEVPSVVRNSSILALRQGKGIVSFTLSGEQADADLAKALSAALPSLACEVRPVAGAPDFLARALAEDGARRDLSPACNFRDDSFPHDAAARRLLVRSLLAAAFLACLGVSALAVALVGRGRSERILDRCDRRLTTVACDLAGRQLPVSGAAALEMARTEFDQRLNPVIEAFQDARVFDSVALPLDIALTRNLTFSSIEIDGGLARFSGKALSEDDLAIWRRRARESGLSLAIESRPSEDGVGVVFSATQFYPEVP